MIQVCPPPPKNLFETLFPPPPHPKATYLGWNAARAQPEALPRSVLQPHKAALCVRRMLEKKRKRKKKYIYIYAYIIVIIIIKLKKKPSKWHFSFFFSFERVGGLHGERAPRCTPGRGWALGIFWGGGDGFLAAFSQPQPHAVQSWGLMRD